MDIYGVNYTWDNQIKMSTGEELIHSRLNRLLFTEQDSIIGNPNEGSLIPLFFYDPMDEITVKEILTETEYLITNYEPTLTLNAVSVYTINDNGTYGIVIDIDCTENNIRYKNIRIIKARNSA